VEFFGDCCSSIFPRLNAPDLEFSRLESWSRDVSRPVFTSLGLGLGLEPRSLGLGLGLESWDHGDSVFVTHEA